MALPLVMACSMAAGQPVPAPCRVVAFEGVVHTGQTYQTPALNGIDVRLAPTASGWVFQVLPSAHRGEDWAEMATPPYSSVTPLAVSTDWSFRAQDAVGWNPRQFRFAANQATFLKLQSLRKAVEAGQSAQVGALAELVSQQPEGLLEILDAHLVPGTADQTRAAGLVAGHFSATAHQLEQPATGRPTPLGAITWLRFRVSLQLPSGMQPVAGKATTRAKACGKG